MSESTQVKTSSAAAAEQETIKAIETKLAGLSTIMEGFKNTVDEFSKTMADENSKFFQNMSSVMFGSMQRNDADRRAYEEARAQNDAARRMAMGANGPERGQAGFWEAAFATRPENPEEAQAKATAKAIKEAFSTATIRNAVQQGDDRTTGEKALDFMGLGFINKIKNKFQDRDLIKEEKATKKDQDQIAREMKERSRLEAKIRKVKSSGGGEEELDELMTKLRDVSDNIKAAEARIDARKTPIDPYGDLKEKNPDQNLIDAVRSPLLPLNPNEQGNKQPAVPVKKTEMPDIEAEDLEDYYSKLEDSMNTPSAPKKKPGPKKEMPDIEAEDLEDYYAKLEESMETPSGPKEAEETAAAKDSAGMKGAKKPIEVDSLDISTGGDKKEAADIARWLDTKLRPEFYQEGTKFFKKANSGKLFEGLGTGGGGLLGGKAGLWAAGGAAVAASLGTIAFAGKKFKDLMDTKAQVKDNLNKMTEGNIENNKKLKKGWNDDMRDSLSELLEAEKNLRNAGFFNGDEQKAVEAAKQKFEAEKKKLREFTKAAREAGIDTNDADAMNRFKEEYDRNGGKVASAGNAGQKAAPTAGTPGGQVNTDKVETAEEKAAREEETMYRAVKRAQLDDEVQKQNLENAKATGQQIDQSLVGRK